MATKKEQKNTEQRIDKKPLTRSETNKVIAGVAGGLGEYFEIDPTLIRLVFILLTIFGGSGVIIYIIFWLIMPSASSISVDAQSTIQQNVNEISNKAKSFAQNIQFNSEKENSKFWWGLIIIIFGFMLLFNNFGLFDLFNFEKIWPIILIAIGLIILLKKR